MPRLYAFDLHETLIDGNIWPLLETTNGSLAYHGKEKRYDIDGIKKMRGKPWSDFFRALYPGLTQEEADSMVVYARELALKNDMEIVRKYIRPMDNSLKLLNEIRGRGDEIAIISNTINRNLKIYLEIVGMYNLVDYVLGITEEEEEKGFDTVASKGGRLRGLLEGKQYEKIVMVGDTKDDVRAGNSVDATSIYFNPSGETMEEADYSISDLLHVLNIL